MHALADPDPSQFDIGEVNLRCARGLPGTEAIDFGQCLTLLDRWTEYVDRYTKQTWGGFERDPDRFWNSPAKFRTLALVTALQRDLGVTYDASCLEDPIDYTDAAPWFICGPITGRGGTCASLPFLYAAIGRRLGYPLFFVTAKEHLCLRWEEPGERFLIECTMQGFEPRRDDYYLTWPKPLSEEDLATGLYLRNLSSQEELAECRLMRGNCLFDHLRIEEALRAWRQARTLCPGNPFCENAVAVAMAARAYLDYEDAGADFDRLVPGSAGTPAFKFARQELARVRSLHAQRRVPPSFDPAITESFFATPG